LIKKHARKSPHRGETGVTIQPHPPTSPTRHFQSRGLIIPGFIMLVLWGSALAQWQHGGDRLFALLLAYIGVFAGLGIGVYIALPAHQRPNGRRWITLLLGVLLLVIALISDHGNMQLEGLFFGALSGFTNYIVLHYALAKIIGPLVFGRVWCGWACWFGMVFDWLPYPYSRYRIPGKLGYLRYAHFGLSLLLVIGLWLAGYREGAFGTTGLLWFIWGLGLYYAFGILLAFLFKDNRAFCKYLCPLTVLLKTGSRFALLKIAGIPQRCDRCNVCVERCPMNIRIPDYILNGKRVLSTECTLCQTCINICPQAALKLSVGCDRGGEELLDYVPPKYSPPG
jgi:ferredoxin-type protein NapH